MRDEERAAVERLRNAERVGAVAAAIRDFARPDAELGWVGLPITADVADEMASFLADRGLI